jgi:hypothetical protein
MSGGLENKLKQTKEYKVEEKHASRAAETGRLQRDRENERPAETLGPRTGGGSFLTATFGGGGKLTLSGPRGHHRRHHQHKHERRLHQHKHEPRQCSGGEREE